MFFEGSSDEEEYYPACDDASRKARGPTLGDFLKPAVTDADDWAPIELSKLAPRPILLVDAMKDDVDKSCLDAETLHVLLDELRIAAWNGNLSFVSKYVPELIDINVKFKNNWTLLLSAAFGAQECVLEYLLDLPGCNAKEIYKSFNLLMAAINAEISNLEFPSDNEIERRIINCLTMLIDAGAQVNAGDSFGTTPLMFAVRNNQMGVLQYLLSSGARVHSQDSHGDTALHVACRKGYVSAALLLLQHGADVKIRNKSYETAIQCATVNDHKKLAHLLTSYTEKPQKEQLHQPCTLNNESQ